MIELNRIRMAHLISAFGQASGRELDIHSAYIVNSKRELVLVRQESETKCSLT